RGEDRHVRAALTQELQLVLLDGLADEVVRDIRIFRRLRTCFERRALLFAPLEMGFGGRRVVTMTINDQDSAPSLVRSCSSLAVRSGPGVRPRWPIALWMRTV